MKKRFLSMLLAMSLLVIPAHAAENSMENFIRDTESHAYTGQFPDVPQEHTFYNNVAALYEYGLTKGKTDGTFGLTDNVTVSQVIIFAGRIRSLFSTGDAEFGPSAYQTAEPQATCMPYLAYLKAEQVLGDELDDMLFTHATRAQVAHVLANVLPKGTVPSINQDLIAEAYATRKFILDVDEYTPYQQDILALYRMGISCGSDEMGSFLPDQPITRGALTAMLTRLVDAELRIEFIWKSYEIPDVSQMTMADLVTAGEYIASPVTDAEMDSSISYMLAAGQNQLELTYPSISVSEARQKMQQALRIVKSYVEQGYNAIQCTFQTVDNLLLAFSSTFAKEDLAQYREDTMSAAISVHDYLWGNGFITNEMSELEKAKIYYIWICQNCEYDHDADDSSISHLPYGLFLNGTAVCDGYTGAYNLLLKLEGIDCTSAMTESHIWTVATLDGETYHIDTTWGDVGAQASLLYFAMSPEFSATIHKN